MCSMRVENEGDVEMLLRLMLMGYGIERRLNHYSYTLKVGANFASCRCDRAKWALPSYRTVPIRMQVTILREVAQISAPLVQPCIWRSTHKRPIQPVELRTA
jgi:hypothetical protein